MPLTQQTRDKLKKVSTASVATALYKRGIRNQFIQDVAPAQSQPADHGRGGLYSSLHPGAGGF